MNEYFFFVSLGLYIFSTLLYLLYFSTQKDAIERRAYELLIFALSFHLLSLTIRYFEAGYTPLTNLYEALSFTALSIGGFFVYLRSAYNVRVLGSFFLPLITILVTISSLLPREIKPLPPVLQSFYLPIHTVFSFLGNSIFFASFLVSIIYLLTEHFIKKKRIPPFAMRLPALEVLDRINLRCISIGFPFLTLGIITGSLWASYAWGSYWSWDPKEVWSLITWIIYAIVIHRRAIVGWKGRKTAYMMILGFLSVVITFLGVNYLMGGKHSYL